ncbi:MAG: nicotinamide mononucleotide transporter [Rickettsiaceae bacterium]|nr:nicotinamide mononucleotide transporter [Rickettsiaceae bacterium]
MNSWYGWIVADSIYIYLMASQKLYFHMFLFSCYLISAIIGLKNWQRLKNIADENLIEQTT